MINKIRLVLSFGFIASFCFGQVKDKPEQTEVWEPVPVKVVPGVMDAPPSDAIVLFDGSSLDAWEKAGGEGVVEWLLKDGAMEVKPGSGGIKTKAGFGDVQLHIEWLSPVDEGKEGQLYSNSGVFFMGLYEVQVLNSYENKTYPNGHFIMVCYCTIMQY